MGYPEEYRTWDEQGKAKNFDRLVTAENGMVVSLRYEASKIGADIMEAGGNAIDAAVATAFAQFVVMPEMCGIGGGGLMTYYDAKSKETVFLSFREVAPKFQTAELWVEDGEGNVVGEHKSFGGLACGVPGEVAGLWQAHQEYGSMDWKDLVQPAIDLAREGYIGTPALNDRGLTLIYDNLIQNTELSEIYLTEDGMIPEVGSVIKNEYLARALEMIRDEGPDAVYKGAIGEAMVKAVQDAGGVMTMDDLAAYEPWSPDPAVAHYRDYTIYSAASPSSGGTFIAEILNIKENLPVYDFNTVEYWHQLAEVQKMVWVDRAEFSGDTRFVDVPVEGLMDPEYAKKLAGQIDMTKAQEYTHGNPWEFDNSDHPETTSFSVADKEGNMVTITHTLNWSFGSRVYVNGFGFFMNDQLDDFVVGSGYANSLEPGKCPLSSMSPTVVLDPEGKPFMTAGSPGGWCIYPAIAQVISTAIDYGFNIDEAINAPRIGATSVDVEYSHELEGSPVLDELKALGHEEIAPGFWGGLIGVPSGIMYMPDGTMQASVESDQGPETFSDGVAVGF